MPSPKPERKGTVPLALLPPRPGVPRDQSKEKEPFILGSSSAPPHSGCVTLWKAAATPGHTRPSDAEEEDIRVDLLVAATRMTEASARRQLPPRLYATKF